MLNDGIAQSFQTNARTISEIYIMYIHFHSKPGYHWYSHWFASDRTTNGSTGTQTDVSTELCAIGCGVGVRVPGAEYMDAVRWATSGRNGWG
jgi:hypothetical protein